MSTWGNDESGAVLVIVALSMFAFLGMTMLVVDVGGLLVARRQIVRGADSGALAAAQTCATTGQTLSAAEADADEFSRANQASGKQAATQGEIIDFDGCGTKAAGYVTVRYEIPQDFFFAPVLGLPEGMRVPARAKAIWGPAGTGAIAPLMVSLPGFQGDCDPPNMPKDEECNFYYDHDDLGSADWGWLSLFPEGHNKWGWDVPKDHNCSNSSAKERRDWLENPVEVPPLNWPNATYVCVDTGLANSDWQAIRDLIAANGGEVTVMFPVNDQSTQVDKDGNIASESPDKFNVIGFVELIITDVLDGNDPAVLGTLPTSAQIVPCPNQPPDHTFTAADPTFDLTQYIDECMALNGGIAPIEPPAVQSPYKLDDDYSYNSSTDVITWLEFPKAGSKKDKVEDVEITLSYIKPGSGGTAGVCGEHFDGKNQDKCLVATWAGFTHSGGNPGGGADFGVRPIRLDE
ncbi:MAG: pilus assembly protein TadG-related protein [Actinomycetota bacterium]